jgi:transcriptional regulator with XRE-family HTH domain
MAEQWLLFDLRRELRLTQEDVGRAAGLPQIRISQLERGVDAPTPEERDRILQGLVRRAAVRGLEILILDRN